MKKVACYFGGRTQFGGAERRIGRIMNQVAKSDIEVQFIFKLYEPMEEICKTYEHVIGEKLNIKMVGFQHGVEIIRYMLVEKFDSVFYTDAYLGMIPFFVGAKLAKSETVLLQVNTYASVGQFKSLANELEFKMVARLSNRIDCLYPSSVARFRMFYPHKNITVTPCPFTNTELYAPASKTRAIVFAGRWVEGKNVDLFVRAMLRIQDELYEEGYKIYVCGEAKENSLSQTVRRLIATCKYNELFELPGFVDSKDYLPWAEVFLSLQVINNYPSQSLLEAISCGCYIIASDEGDTGLLVKDEYGELCKLEEKDIAEKMLNYIRKTKQEKELAICDSRKFAISHFMIDKSVEHYVNMINGVI